MAAHFKDTGFLTFPFERLPQVRAAHVHPLGDGGAGQVFAGLEEVFDFTEYPRVADGSTANHDAVHLVLHAPCRSLLYAVHVAIAEDGDTDTGVAFDFADKVPIGLPFVHLRAGTAMDA